MNHQPLKMQLCRQTTKRRCAFRASHISWCKKLEKTCDSPKEYHFCSSYQAKHPAHPTKLPAQQSTENKQTFYPKQNLSIETKIGKCDICKATKRILLLRYGFILCQDCLTICTNILEQLALEKTNQAPKDKALASRQTSQFSTKPKEA